MALKPSPVLRRSAQVEKEALRIPVHEKGCGCDDLEVQTRCLDRSDEIASIGMDVDCAEQRGERLGRVLAEIAEGRHA
jgi:hypothetical protein